MQRKIIVVTGKLAMNEARRQINLLNRAGYNVKLEVFNIDVAVFINDKILAKWINNSCNDLQGGLIIIPGGSKVESNSLYSLLKCNNVKVVKGPIHISDLYHYITTIPPDDWILDQPIDRLHENEKRSSTMNVYKKLTTENLGLKSSHSKIVIPIEPPPFIPLGELYIDSYFAKHFSDKLSWIIESEFPSIIIGSIKNDVDAVKTAIRMAEKEGFKGIIGIDLPPSCKSIELITTTSAELFLSMNNHDLMKLEGCLRTVKNSIIPVIIPANVQGSRKSKILSLSKAVKKAYKMKITKIILDPIISPPFSNRDASILDSLLISRYLNEKHRKPVLLGLSNYIELVDSDSPGLVFGLVQLSIEAKVSLGLFSEESYKTQGVLQEALVSAIMNSYSAKYAIPPKDLGVNLLVLKDKKRSENVLANYIKIVGKANKKQPIGDWDPTGPVNVAVDHTRKLVLVKKKKWDYWIGSHEWRPLIEYLLNNNEISRIGHAFYLGRELYKAILALKLGKNYVQDKRLFQKSYLDGLEKEEKDFEI